MLKKTCVTLGAIALTVIVCCVEDRSPDWGGDGRSIVNSIREARAQERRYNGISARERYLRSAYQTAEAMERIMPIVRK